MTRVLLYSAASNAPLAQNQQHLFAAHYALSLYPSEAIYSFIPKNACSTLRYSLAIANGAIEGPGRFNWIHNNNNTFKATLGELVRSKYAFVVLRDPYLRLASCFLDKIVDQTPVAYSYMRLTEGTIAPRDLTFRAFVAGLAPHLRADEHWRPQIDFLVFKSYDDIFCFEDFPTVVKTLKEKIGFEVHDARALARHGTDQFAEADGDDCVADLSAFDLMAMKRAGKAPRLRDFYDPSLADQVGDLYKEDVVMYRELCGRSLAF